MWSPAPRVGVTCRPGRHADVTPVIISLQITSIYKVVVVGGGGVVPRFGPSRGSERGRFGLEEPATQERSPQ